MRPLETFIMYPSELEAATLHSEIRFEQLIGITVDEAIDYAIETAGKRAQKRYRRIGPYATSGSATAQRRFLKDNYSDRVAGTFTTKTRRHSDRSGRTWLLVHYEPTAQEIAEARTTLGGELHVQ